MCVTRSGYILMALTWVEMSFKGALPLQMDCFCCVFLFLFSVYCGHTSLVQVECALTVDSSKPNLKSKNPSGAEIYLSSAHQLLFGDIPMFFVLFFPAVALGFLRNITEPYF